MRRTRTTPTSPPPLVGPPTVDLVYFHLVRDYDVSDLETLVDSLTAFCLYQRQYPRVPLHADVQDRIAQKGAR